MVYRLMVISGRPIRIWRIRVMANLMILKMMKSGRRR